MAMGEEVEYCDCSCSNCSGCTGELVEWRPIPDSMIQLVPATNENGSYSELFLAALRGTEKT